MMHSRLEDKDDQSTKDSNLGLAATVSADYGSTQQLQQQHPEQDKLFPAAPSIFCSCRLLLYVMCYLGLFFAAAYRIAINEVIVAMVNSTAYNGIEEFAENQSSSTENDVRHAAGSKSGEFNWSRQQQTTLVAAFFYGYFPVQISSGWLADRFGGRWPFGVSMLFVSTTALLSPVAATIRYELLVTLRFIAGLAEGAKIPSMGALVASWAPANERSTVVSFIVSAVDSGVIFGLMIGGALCDHGFAGGWPSVFYVFAIIGFAWSALWFLLCYSSPTTHPRVSKAERAYLEKENGLSRATGVGMRPKTPWLKIFTSVHVWALTGIVFCLEWTYEMLTLCVPIYFHDILRVGMTANGLLGSLPFIAGSVTVPLSGWLSDRLRASGVLSLTAIRKAYCAVTLIPCGLLLILVGFLGANKAAVITAITVAIAGLGFTVTTAYANQFDLSPSHAGMLVGITAGCGIVASMIAPNVIGAFTSDISNAVEWRNVFYVTAALNITGTIFYLVCGSAKRQKWADPIEHSELQVD